MKKLTIDKENFNWYNLDHKAVENKYGDKDGNLDYVGTFVATSSGLTCAIYHAKKPDLKKKHKHYLGLFLDVNNTLWVAGFTKEELKQYVKQEGVYCPECDTVVYSVNRNDFRYCKCKQVFVDGGRDYLKRSAQGIAVMIDHKTGTAIPKSELLK